MRCLLWPYRLPCAPCPIITVQLAEKFCAFRSVFPHPTSLLLCMPLSWKLCHSIPQGTELKTCLSLKPLSPVTLVCPFSLGFSNSHRSHILKICFFPNLLHPTWQWKTQKTCGVYHASLGSDLESSLQFQTGAVFCSALMGCCGMGGA